MMSTESVTIDSTEPETANTIPINNPSDSGVAPAELTGSVISAMTEPELLEEPVSSAVMDVAAVSNTDVPSQVILSVESLPVADTDTSVAKVEVTGSDQPPLVVTSSPFHSEETVSCSAIPDPQLSLEATGDRSPSKGQGKTMQEPSSAVSSPVITDHKVRDDDDLDEYIRSPEVQNAIVERSPGGRYVRFMEKLGSGASKDVYRAYDTQEGIEVAWNVVNLSGVPKAERNRIVNEVRLLERLHHQNIISFHGSWVNRERQEVNFVTEILSSGTLKSFITKVQLIRWKIAKRWATQILKGLEYLHSQEPPIIHRDLKAENIFINGTSGDLRIGDLGLSTVHRNGRVLSVLGTPEFMAPDMYEGGSYDIKVDIYAFGMVMLEIFTKEIPYSECMNPAQIYKKVSVGEPPEVLKRLQSRHARDFVKLCLGYKDESGNFVRPTAKELLEHPFLEVREGDDEEVLVRPPLIESTISEEAGESSTTSPMSSPSKHRHSASEVSTGKSQSESEKAQSGSRAVTPRHKRQNSLESDDGDGDQFDEMPESETNMKKVTVLMGRGHELEEKSQELKPENATKRVGKQAEAAEGVKSENQQYLVAAAVVGLDDPDTRPYPDEILKLIVTLPVDGQTQNVQFDFHLVEDEPIQVAKEMVQELDIPQDAILEISQTISSLARNARKQIDAFHSRINENRAHAMNAQQKTAGMLSISQQGQPHQYMDSLPIAQQQQRDYSSTFSAPSVSEYSGQFVSQVPSNMQVQNHPQAHMYGQTQHNTAYPNDTHLSLHQAHAQLQQQQPQQQQQQMMQQPQQTMQTQIYGQPQHSQMQHHQHQLHAQMMQQPQQTQMMQQQPSLQQSQMVQQQQAPQQMMQQQTSLQMQPQQGQIQHQSQMLQHPPTAPIQHHAQIQTQQPQMQHPSQSQMQQAQAQMQQQPANSQMQSQPAPPQGLMQGPQHVHPPSQTTMQVQQASMQHVPTVQVQYPQGQQSYTHVQTSQHMPTPQSPRLNQHVQLHSSELEPKRPDTLGQVGGALSNSSTATVTNVRASVNRVLSEGAPMAAVVQSQHISEDSSTGSSQHPHATYSLPDSLQGEPPKMVQRSGTNGSQMDSTCNSSPSMNGSTGPVSPDISENADTDSESDVGDEEEIRKLEEEFKKNLQRTRKVFDSRMESLQRTLIERETQHQKTLEKHEKERYEFEKRLAQEEEQQNRRLEQLQKEWEMKRAQLADSKRRTHEKTVNVIPNGHQQPVSERPSSALSELSQDRNLSNTPQPDSEQIVSQPTDANTG